jgi:hypothetical protein
MKWKNHDKWTKKLGISKGVSRYVNNIIDAIREGKTLPQEYTDFVNKESRRIAEQSKRRVGALAMAIESETLKHDSARRKRTSGKIASEIQLKFLKIKGKDFVKAWYLHHALDYLNDNKDLIKNVPSESIETLFIKYQKNRPVTFSEEIIDFLKNNLQELKKDLDL